MATQSVLPKPNLFAARRILCVQPHHDDKDIGAGGALALLQRGGAELHCLAATNDVKGAVGPSRRMKRPTASSAATSSTPRQ